MIDSGAAAKLASAISSDAERRLALEAPIWTTLAVPCAISSDAERRLAPQGQSHRQNRWNYVISNDAERRLALKTRPFDWDFHHQVQLAVMPKGV